MYRKVLIAGLLLLPIAGWSQSALERSVVKHLEKKKWEKAYQYAYKALMKDSLSIPARYSMARYYFKDDNPFFHVDSAYQYSQKALDGYRQLPAKEQERLRRLAIDSVKLWSLRRQIDSAAFEHARRQDTEHAYLYFLGRYTAAAQREEALHLLHRAAYREAETVNTYQAFYAFMQRYPHALQRQQASARYEQLLYETMTRGKRVADYEAFLRDYPRTPYRKEVERFIFEGRTAIGSAESFERFLNDYPGSEYARHARNILFHLYQEEYSRYTLPTVLKNDSLQQVMDLSKGYLIPYLHQGRFGFMNQYGRDIIPPRAEEISNDYLCGNITEEVLALSDELIGRNGAVVLKGTITALDDLGHGFLKVETSGCTRVIHKSGLPIGDSCAERAKLLDGRFLALQKNNVWSIWTLAGRKLQDYQWDGLTTIESVVVGTIGKKHYLITPAQLAGLADQRAFAMPEAYDEVKALPNGFIGVRRADLYGVVNQQLTFHIPLARQQITPAFFGHIVTVPAGTKLVSRSGGSPLFAKAEVLEPWVAVTSEGTWRFYDVFRQEFFSVKYDTIQLYGAYAAGVRNDSVHVYLSRKNIIHESLPSRFDFLTGTDSARFVVLDFGERKTVYTGDGIRLFTAVYDRIQYAGDGLFIVHKKEKKGMVNAEGKLILPVEYDAIGTARDGAVSVLKAMKFGLYNYRDNKIIKPEYEKNLVLFSRDIVTAFKSGYMGFIDWNTRTPAKFEFEDIQPWNDSIALVKKNNLWSFYDVRAKRVVLENIKSWKMLRNKVGDRLAIIRIGDNFGVVSSQKGMVLPVNFTDIVNVGSEDEPTYFTEKHVAEALLFVVIYYDQHGKLLRREVYEHDDYERIYCTQ